MLLRNLSSPKLCNGTRLKVISLHRHTIEAEILTGCGVSEAVFIPRIPLIPHSYPCQIKRIQFPVSVCFALTALHLQDFFVRCCSILGCRLQVCTTGFVYFCEN
ncbi:unnamed protein product [Chilo suppressalis]|uniref:DNA helicase Pif1-like 2B domain-containing protein n=1 Tax=Chilo suppressalis TaxID=168631 RepID=A0ABN8AS06_CHISP|nr:unnamed protein product [Chilo suppressalis]